MKINLLKKGLYDISELSSKDLEVISDLELNELFKAAAKDDPFLERTFPKILVHHLDNIEDIKYRQDVYKDLKKYKQITKDLYTHTRHVILDLRSKYPFGIISDSVHQSIVTSQSILTYLVDQIDYIRGLVYQYKDITSEGLINFRNDVLETFSKENIIKLKNTLEALDPSKGVMVNSSLSDTMSFNEYGIGIVAVSELCINEFKVVKSTDSPAPISGCQEKGMEFTNGFKTFPLESLN